MIKDDKGKTASISMKIKQNSAKLKHGRLSATTTRSCSIQDNILSIVTSMDLGGNRKTTLSKELNLNNHGYNTLQSSEDSTTNYIFYSIELPH